MPSIVGEWEGPGVGRREQRTAGWVTRGQGQGGITTSCTLEPIRAEEALGTTVAEAHLT